MRGKNKQGDVNRVRPLELYYGFQNDLPSYAESDNLFMHADDHQIYRTGGSIEKTAQELKSGIGKVTQWYKVNLLKANPSKYQIIAINPKSSKKEPADELSLQIDNQVVQSSDKLTTLGVTIDDKYKLTFSEHIKDISKRASQKSRSVTEVTLSYTLLR